MACQPHPEEEPYVLIREMLETSVIKEIHNGRKTPYRKRGERRARYSCSGSPRRGANDRLVWYRALNVVDKELHRELTDVRRMLLNGVQSTKG